MRCIFAIAAVVVGLGYGQVGHAQDLRWNDDFEQARKAASSGSKKLLIFFTTSEALRSDYYEKLFRDERVKRELAEKYELLRLDLNENLSLATQLRAYRAGTINVYDSSGAGLGQITDRLAPQDLVAALRKFSGEPPPEPAASPGSSPASPEATPVLFARGTPPNPLPKGKTLRGPVMANPKSKDAISFGVLQAGKGFILALDGEWSMVEGKARGADPLYLFSGEDVVLSPLIRIKGNDMPLYEYYQQKQGYLPVYNSGHIYEVPITGEGKEFSIYFSESESKSLKDSNVPMRISLYEAQ